ncbi:MAG: acetyltransferase [Syntrophomonadaceae bacterium]|nr:acetyltransferase [Syntrophomonadaceae bacterium]
MNRFNELINQLFVHPRLSIDNSSQYWDRTVLCKVDNLRGLEQKFCSANRQLDQDIITSFGTDEPGADQYLLHFAPGWDSNVRKQPVILLPGAGLDANSFTNLYGMGMVGLQQQLTAFGYRVFALTFSHSHGDNFYQAEQLADAITRVKSMCGVGTVDVLAHSKGGLAARIYLSDLAFSRYRGDVRRFVMLGTPNLGLDFAFRNPSLSLPLYLSGSNGVIAWDRINYMGSYLDTSENSIYLGGCFPGQSQMLFPWADKYPLDMTQTDWWTTYYGGTGFMSHSHGIEKAMQDGGNLITRLEKAGIHPGVELAVLAGNNQMFGLVPGEGSGQGDGLVFLESVFHTDGMTSQGARMIAKTQLYVNHLEMLFHSDVAGWVDRQLRDD